VPHRCDSPKSSEGYGTQLIPELAKNDVQFALLSIVRRATVLQIQAVKDKKKVRPRGFHSPILP